MHMGVYHDMYRHGNAWVHMTRKRKKDREHGRERAPQVGVSGMATATKPLSMRFPQNDCSIPTARQERVSGLNGCLPTP